MSSRATFTLGQYIFLCVTMYGLGALGGAMVTMMVLR